VFHFVGAGGWAACEQAGPPSLSRGAALAALVPLPALKTQCGGGVGLAACPALGLLVTSDYDKNTLSVWELPGGVSGDGDFSGGAEASAGAGAGGASAGRVRGGGLRLVCTLGGAGSLAPMQFIFERPRYSDSGYLAFIPPTTATTTTTTTTRDSSSSSHPLLLVTDAGHDAVHVVDVVGRTHAGYVASPGSIAGPRGVAASGTSPLVAVSAWRKFDRGDHVVVVYRGSGAVWEVVRVIGGGFGSPGSRDGQLDTPYGLRFSGDGSGVCVADANNHRASVFRVGDGGFARHIATALSLPLDVEEVEGGWLVACDSSETVECVGDGVGGDACGRSSLGKAGGGKGSGDGEFDGLTALAVVPGVGLVVREYLNDGRLQVFATPDAIAMWTMSHMRAAWMVAAVARARSE
jgi:hypothetical protein